MFVRRLFALSRYYICHSFPSPPFLTESDIECDRSRVGICRSAIAIAVKRIIDQIVKDRPYRDQ